MLLGERALGGSGLLLTTDADSLPAVDWLQAMVAALGQVNRRLWEVEDDLRLLEKKQSFGEDFVRKLLIDQQPVISKEPRQQMDWLTSGRYPIAFGIPKATFLEYGERGVSTMLPLQFGDGRIQKRIDPSLSPQERVEFLNGLSRR